MLRGSKRKETISTKKQPHTISLSIYSAVLYASLEDTDTIFQNVLYFSVVLWARSIDVRGEGAWIKATGNDCNPFIKIRRRIDSTYYFIGDELRYFDSSLCI